jgi:hypothetical protein
MAGKVTNYAGTNLTVNVTRTGGSGTASSWAINLSGDIGPAGTSGTSGSSGTSGEKGGVEYNFSTTIAAADPGAGVFRYNNGTIGSVSVLYINDNDQDSVDQSNWFNTWDKRHRNIFRFCYHCIYWPS